MTMVAPPLQAIGRQLHPTAQGCAVGTPQPQRAASIDAAPPAASLAAGDSDRIPRVILGALDLLVLASAFLAAHVCAPAVQRLLLPGGLFAGVLPAGLPVPSGPTAPLDFPPLSETVWLLLATAPAALVVMELAGGYRRLLGQSAVRLVANAAVAQTVAISFGALILFALKLSDSSRVITFTYALLSIAGLVAYRSALWGYQRRRLARGVYAKNVLVIGAPHTIEWMVAHFGKHVPETEFRLTGWLSVRAVPPYFPERRRGDADRDIGAPTAPARWGAGIALPQLGSVDDLGRLLVHHPIHEVIVIQSSGERDRLGEIVAVCDYYRARLRIVPEELLVGSPRALSLTYHSDPLRLPEVVLSPPYLDADSLAVKRLVDVVVSAALLVLLAPLFLLIAIALKLATPHLSVFYPWNVVGLCGRPFTGYKFTTMVADADAQKQKLLPLNEMTGPVFKVKNDPRITRLGRVLRKYSLNELPQLWSVLKGDMSLVGPRPAFRHELERYELWHKRKLCVKPGLTCLWQVGGRNRISDFDEWVRLDLEYIDGWSLWLDMRILSRTVWAVVAGSGS